jgi:2-polyprenyl-3-methyl-5-hydroxy-6-metoxy-1,4-benzoquinol methylase
MGRPFFIVGCILHRTAAHLAVVRSLSVVTRPNKHIDLDIFARLLKVFADTPWLHYGLWLEGETPSFPGVRVAQERHVDKLLSLLPAAPAAVLDIGGGTGALAERLASLGYAVEMLTPSAVQVQIAREALGDTVTVHETRLEDFSPERRFDVCLYSESFQYVPLAASFAKLDELLAPGGRVVIADCFRAEGFAGRGVVGGGHRFTNFLAATDGAGYAITSDEDVTAMAAPSIALDRMIYREALSPVVTQLGELLAERRPVLNWLVLGAYRVFVSRTERERIARRLKAEQRTPEIFAANNTYRFLTLEKRA